MIEWTHYPKSSPPPALCRAVVSAIESQAESIESEKHGLKSNDVLAHVTEDLEELGFKVERGKKASQKIHVPVLFGRNGKVEKFFDADACHEEEGFVLEVEDHEP